MLTADGHEQHSSGRTGVYDITVTNQDGRTVALFRGKSFRLGTHILTPPQTPEPGGGKDDRARPPRAHREGELDELPPCSSSG